eukprot:GHVT01024853.1.p1 GENE.GHVT01024853.1~~GHVT01024853.1.p1  ORF type:complete len:283 (+),score=29.92 GHVT01024853.1:850-1698(+)
MRLLGRLLRFSLWIVFCLSGLARVSLACSALTQHVQHQRVPPRFGIPSGSPCVARRELFLSPCSARGCAFANPKACCANTAQISQGGPLGRRKKSAKGKKWRAPYELLSQQDGDGEKNQRSKNQTRGTDQGDENQTEQEVGEGDEEEESLSTCVFVSSWPIPFSLVSRTRMLGVISFVLPWRCSSPRAPPLPSFPSSYWGPSYSSRKRNLPRAGLQVFAVGKSRRKKGPRIRVTLECSEARELGLSPSRYSTSKNKRTTPGKMELMKYNWFLKRHTLHREIK